MRAPVIRTATLLILFALVLAACGSDPTPVPTDTPAATNTPESTPTPAATLAPGEPTHTPAPATPTSMPSPTPSGRDMEAHFNGETVTLIAGTSPGGTYDLTARLFARLLPSHLPGDPRIVVQNVPGAGQLRGHQQVYTADPDGMTTGMLNASRWFIRPYVLGEEISNFDILEIQPVCGFRATARLYVLHRNIADSWEEFLERDEPLVIGTTERPGGILNESQAVDKNPDGILHIVPGYGGGGDQAAAWERGEIDAHRIVGAGQVTAMGWTPDTAVPIYYTNNYPTGILEALGYDPATADVPHFTELPGTTWPEGIAELISIDETLDDFSQALFLGPEVPEDIVHAYRQACASMAEDPVFVEAFQTAIGVDPEYKPGEDLFGAFDLVRELGPEKLETWREIISP